MSFLTEAAVRRVATLSVPRTMASAAPRAAFSTGVQLQKSAVDSTKETLKSVDRSVSDKVVDGIDAATTIGNKFKEGVKEIYDGKATGKAEQYRAEAAGKAAELSGEAKGAAAEAAGKVEGAAEKAKQKL